MFINNKNKGLPDAFTQFPLLFFQKLCLFKTLALKPALNALCRNSIMKGGSDIPGYISHDQFTFQDLSMDDGTRDILQLLKDNTEYLFLVLEFIQAVRLLQLRETHFREMVRSLKGRSQEKVKLKIDFFAL